MCMLNVPRAIGAPMGYVIEPLSTNSVTDKRCHLVTMRDTIQLDRRIGTCIIGMGDK